MKTLGSQKVMKEPRSQQQEGPTALGLGVNGRRGATRASSWVTQHPGGHVWWELELRRRWCSCWDAWWGRKKGRDSVVSLFFILWSLANVPLSQTHPGTWKEQFMRLSSPCDQHGRKRRHGFDWHIAPSRIRRDWLWLADMEFIALWELCSSSSTINFAASFHLMHLVAWGWWFVTSKHREVKGRSLSETWPSIYCGLLGQYCGSVGEQGCNNKPFENH